MLGRLDSPLHPSLQHLENKNQRTPTADEPPREPRLCVNPVPQKYAKIQFWFQEISESCQKEFGEEFQENFQN